MVACPLLEVFDAWNYATPSYELLMNICGHSRAGAEAENARKRLADAITALETRASMHASEVDPHETEVAYESA